MDSIGRLTAYNSFSSSFRPFTKKPSSFHEQIEKLEARGMVFDDRDSAYFLLQHISYYRLEAYWFSYYEPSQTVHRFQPGTSFSSIWSDYLFDRKLRAHVLQGLERIEVSFKTQFIYCLAHKYGPFPFKRENFVFGQSDWDEIITKLKEECANSKEQFAEHLRNTYGCEIFPIWAVVEVMSFGKVVSFYSSIRDKSVMKQISRVYGLSPEILCSWLKHLCIVRNICAHHSRLWNRRFVKTPGEAISIRQDIKDHWQYAPKEASTSDPRNDRRVYNTFLIIDYLLSNIYESNHWKKGLALLIMDSNIDSKRMGFPENWDSDHFWNE